MGVARDPGSDVTPLILPAPALGPSVSLGRPRGTRKRGGTGVYTASQEKKTREIIGAVCGVTGAANSHCFITSLIVITGLRFFFPPPFPNLSCFNTNGLMQVSAFSL